MVYDAKRVIKKYGISASKSLGQNYIIHSDITDSILQSSGNVGDALNDTCVLEVGPGIGTLTRSILEMSNVPKVIAIEKDRQFTEVLGDMQRDYGGRLDVIYGDVMEMDYVGMIKDAVGTYNKTVGDDSRIRNFCVIANLPYNIGTQLIYKLLELIYRLQEGGDGGDLPLISVTAMLQKEVAERIVASPKTKSYGTLSIISQWLCDAQIILDVPRDAFWPMPKVESAVVHMTARPFPGKSCDIERLQSLCKLCFSKRRKIISNSLRNVIEDNAGVASLVQDMGYSGQRPEELSVMDFVSIAKMMNKA